MILKIQLFYLEAMSRTVQNIRWGFSTHACYPYFEYEVQRRKSQVVVAVMMMELLFGPHFLKHLFKDFYCYIY